METTSHLSKGKNPANSRPKRVEKCADSELQDDVDEMILDYLLHNAIKSVLQEHDTQISGGKSSDETESHLSMVDSFINTLKSLHPHHNLPPQCEMRLSLLKIITLITQRFESGPTSPSSSSLEHLRCRNANRAALWWSHQSGTGMNCQKIFYNHQNLAPKSEIRDGFLRNYHKNINPEHIHSSGVSLLDMLTDFMTISAKTFKGDKAQAFAGPWMELAAELCVVSTIEQYVVFAAKDDQPRREAFAWGYDEAATENLEDDLQNINAMFALFNTLESTDWDTTRDQAWLMFENRSHSDFNLTLSALAQKFPLNETENKLLYYFDCVWRALEPPTLVQLDCGHLQGFSEEETQDMLKRVGWYD